MDHHLLAQLSVAVGNGHVTPDRVVRGRSVGDNGVVMVADRVMDGVVTGCVVADREVMDGVMRDEVMMHDPVVVRAVVMDRRRMARMNGGRGRSRERDRRRPETDQQQTRKQTSHGSLSCAFRRPAATHARSCFNTLGTRPGKSSLIRPGPNRSAQAE